MNKITKGISIYPEIAGIDATINYLELASKYGFNRVFTSFLTAEDTGNDDVLKNFTTITAKANELNMEVIADVDPAIYKIFKIKPKNLNFFKELGLKGIRLDGDFGGKIEAELSHNKIGMLIEINASNNLDLIKNLKKYNANFKNIIACFNFYPLEHTGQDYKRFLELAHYYKKNQIRLAAFVTLPKKQKNVIGVWKHNDGMPTIEEHRHESIFNQVRHFRTINLLTDILFSAQGATEEQFKEFNQVFSFNENMIVKIEKIEKGLSAIEKEIIFNFKHNAREDYCSAFYIRATLSRLKYNNFVEPRKSDKKFLEFGDIVILNKKANRYCGELHIITKKIKMDETRNYVGKISDFDKLVIPFILINKFSFKII